MPCLISLVSSKPHTLHETENGWLVQMNFLLGWPIFRCYVSFREWYCFLKVTHSCWDVGLGVERLINEDCFHIDECGFIIMLQMRLLEYKLPEKKTTWSDHFINMIVALISATINDVPRSSY